MNDFLQKVKNYCKSFRLKISKREIILIVSFSLALLFGALWFNQFDILIRNRMDFGFDADEIFWTFFGASVLFLLFSAFSLLICARHCKILFKIVLALGFGFMLACYVQVLFLNGDFSGQLVDNSENFQKIGITKMIVNLAVWMFFFLLPLLYLVFETHYSALSKKKVFEKAVLIGSVIIFSMQSMGVFTAFATVKNPKGAGEYYFSISEQLKLSEEENIVVFLADRLDRVYTDTVFGLYPETEDYFKGFTYYKDNISLYPGTCPSITGLLTGAVITETTTRTEFLPKAWQETILYDELRAKNYRTNALIEQSVTFMDIDDIKGKFDNLVEMNEKDFREIEKRQAASIMTMLGFQRAMPYALKSAFALENTKIASQVVVNFENKDIFPMWCDDKRFERELQNLGLSKTNKKTFSFVSLNGAHINWNFDDDVQGAYETFNMLNDYFAEMKRLNIYDNSTIIILADHGMGNHRASLFIKRKGADASLQLKKDTTTQMSNANFMPTILELIDSDKKTGLSYFDVEDLYGGSQIRYYYPTQWWDGGENNNLIYVGRWKIEGPAGDAVGGANWEFVS